MSNVRIGRDVELLAVRILEQQGYVVQRAIRHARQREGRWYSAGNDLFSCIDIIAKRQGEPMRFIQVTATYDIGKKRRTLAKVPWDDAWESVEIWRYAKHGRPAYFQLYYRADGFRPDPNNRLRARQSTAAPVLVRP